MKLQNEFVVPAGVERAWEVLLDMERVARRPQAPRSSRSPATSTRAR